MKNNPLILTLTLDKEATEHFNRLRKLYFPPERNFLQAHLTLFHQLPMGDATITTTVAEVCNRLVQMQLEVSEPINMGNGVAFKIVSEELQQLHKLLQLQWQHFLIPQDKQKLRPHITVQNKVKPETAKSLANRLRETFKPIMITGTGMKLWEYVGGPWKGYQEFNFQRPNSFFC